MELKLGQKHKRLQYHKRTGFLENPLRRLVEIAFPAQEILSKINMTSAAQNSLTVPLDMVFSADYYLFPMGSDNNVIKKKRNQNIWRKRENIHWDHR